MGVQRRARAGIQSLLFSVIKFVIGSRRFRDEHDNEFLLQFRQQFARLGACRRGEPAAFWQRRLWGR
jgi:hypothetical protein